MGNEDSKKQYFKSNIIKASNETIYIVGIEKAVEEKCSMIGVLGDYGSGKSTVISAYEERNQGNYLKISIPSYLEECEQQDNNELGQVMRDIPKEVRKYMTMDIIAQMEEEFKNNKKFRGIRERLNYYDKSEWHTNDVVILSVVIYFVLIKLLEIDIVVSHQWSANIINTIYPMLFAIMVVAFIRVVREKINFGRIKSFSIFNFGVTDGTEKSYLDYNLNTILQLIQIFAEGKSNPVVIIEDLDRYQNVELLHEVHQLSRLVSNISFVLPLGSQIMEPKKLSKYFDFQITVHPVNETASMCEHIESELKSYRRQLLASSQGASAGPEIKIKLIDTIADDIPDIRVFNSIFNYYLVLKEKYGKVYPNLDKNSTEAQSLRTEMMTIAYLKIYYPKQFNTERFNELIYLYKNLVNNTFRDKFIEKNEELKYEIDEGEEHEIGESLDYWIFKDDFREYIIMQIYETYEITESESEKERKDFYTYFILLIYKQLITYKWIIFISNIGSSTSEEEALIQIDTRRFKTEIKSYIPNNADILFNNYNLSPTLIEYYDTREINSPNFMRLDYFKLLLDNFDESGRERIDKIIKVIEDTIYSIEYLEKTSYDQILNYYIFGEKKEYLNAITFKNQIDDMFRFLYKACILLKLRFPIYELEKLVDLLLITSSHNTKNMEIALKFIKDGNIINQDIFLTIEQVVENSYDSSEETKIAEFYLNMIDIENERTHSSDTYAISDVSKFNNFLNRRKVSIFTQYSLIEDLCFHETAMNVEVVISTFGKISGIDLYKNKQFWNFIKNNLDAQLFRNYINLLNSVINYHSEELNDELLTYLHSIYEERIKIDKVTLSEGVNEYIINNDLFEKNKKYLDYLLQNEMYEKIVTLYSFKESCITLEVEKRIYEQFDKIKSKKEFVQKLNYQITCLPIAPIDPPPTQITINQIKLLAEFDKVYPSFENYRTLMSRNELKRFVTPEFLKKIDVSTIVNSEKKDKVQLFINSHFTSNNLTDQVKIILTNDLSTDININETSRNSPEVNEAVKKRNKKIEHLCE